MRARTIGTVNIWSNHTVELPPERVPDTFERRELSRKVVMTERSRCVGRGGELEALRERLAARRHVLICGSAGVGKTALLRHAANTEVLSADAIAGCEGLLWLSASGKTPGDVLKELAFECFHIQDRVLSTAHLVRPVCALVVLDDVDWSAEQVREVLDAMPGSVFVIASPHAESARLIEPLPLAGLTLADSREMVEDQIGTSLPDGERRHVERLWDRCGGNPGALAQLAAAIRVAGVQGVLSEVADPDGNHVVMRVLVARTGKQAKNALRTLLIFPDVSWGEDLLRRACADLSGVDRLVRGNLVSHEHGRYRVRESVVDLVDPLVGDKAWKPIDRIDLWIRTEASPEQVTAELGVVERVVRRMLDEQRSEDALVLARVVSVKLLPSLWWDRGDRVLELGRRAARETGSREDELHFTYALAARRAADHRTGEAVELLAALIGSAGDDGSRIVDRARSLRAKLLGERAELPSVGTAESPGLLRQCLDAASQLVLRVPLAKLAQDHPREFYGAVAGVGALASVLLVGVPYLSPAPEAPGGGAAESLADSPGVVMSSPAPVGVGVPSMTQAAAASGSSTPSASPPSESAPGSPPATSTTAVPSVPSDPDHRYTAAPDLSGNWRLDFTRTNFGESMKGVPDRYTITWARLDDTRCGTTPPPCFGGQWVHGDHLEGNKVVVAASPAPTGFYGVDVDDDGYQYYNGSLVTNDTQQPLSYSGDWTTDNGRTATFVFTRVP